ncbi:transporter substrate-binding domain-containing protein [Glutamicibacter sp. NPDC087344]|uniref:transporter substrate-binding domain-containing protein n=1 Tax=Glutamicibacter sp. NPDC087344 TaxID=3363994 RepID=UPI00380E01F2
MFKRYMLRSKAMLFVAGLGVAGVLSGCGLSMPTDPEGTLDSVRSQTLRVGVSPNAGFVQIENGEPRGREIILIESFADRLHARIEWTVAGEEQLVGQLEDGALDMVAGGITSKTPWSEEAGMTRPYTTWTDDRGNEHLIILLVRPGENAFLSELEHFLDQTQEMP